MLKKRELSSELKKLILVLNSLNSDVCALEYQDNEDAAVRVRGALIKIRNGEYAEFESLMKDVRDGIIIEKKRRKQK